MACQAILMKINNKQQTRTKLPSWTSEDPDQIIKDVENGKPRIITTIDCKVCKEDLEKNNGAKVTVVN